MCHYVARFGHDFFFLLVLSVASWRVVEWRWGWGTSLARHGAFLTIPVYSYQGLISWKYFLLVSTGSEEGISHSQRDEPSGCMPLAIEVYDQIAALNMHCCLTFACLIQREQAF